MVFGTAAGQPATGKQANGKSEQADEPTLGFYAITLGNAAKRLLSKRLAAEPWVAEADLRPPSGRVLMLIDQHGPVSQKQVSDLLRVDPSDLVSTFDALEAAGYIRRSRDPEDRRRYALTITPPGRKQLKRFLTCAAEVSDHLFAPLDEDERATLRTLLSKVVQHQQSLET